MARKQADHNFSPQIDNRRARHDYHISDKLECGIQLLGSEVKSIRLGKVSLAEGYASFVGNTLVLNLLNVDIAHYPQAGKHQHEPRRPRRLLAHKRELQKLFDATGPKGVTLVPLAMYFVRGKVKVEIGLATGKHHYDKREDLKKKQADRDIQRAMTRKVL
jgi:SsrA-binding protein